MSKYFTSIALICAGLGPLPIDVGITHLLNPDWDAHARVHEVWRLSTNSFIAFIGLYLIWIMQKELLAALLSLCLLLGFWVSVFLVLLNGVLVFWYWYFYHILAFLADPEE